MRLLATYDNNRDFFEQFMENNKHIFQPIIKTTIQAIKSDELSEEQQYDILSKNILRIMGMTNVMRNEYAMVELAKKKAKN